jgi:hypothetical protein
VGRNLCKKRQVSATKCKHYIKKVYPWVGPKVSNKQILRLLFLCKEEQAAKQNVARENLTVVDLSL